MLIGAIARNSWKGKTVIIFDLDGVIRDLHTATHGFPAERQDNWHHRNQYGQDVCRIVESDMNLLHTAPPTKYFEVIKGSLPFINIITLQPESWRPFTMAWIYDHFVPDYVSVIFVDQPEEKFDHVGHDDVIVEDFPLFRDYSRVALVEYPYNQHITGEYARIRSVEEMKAFIEVHKW